MALQSNPYDQYKKTQVNTASQGKLIVMLYDGAIKFLTIAAESMEPKTYDIVNHNIIRAQDIITELISSLNLDSGGEIANNLLSLYLYFKKRLLEANMQKDSKILEEVMKHLRELRDAWNEISNKESSNDNAGDRKGSFSIEG
ncbi:MAG: flagellar export chaperone FliS [Spirochaetes bacterium]|nr:flagellar export chaperone FliS [Spirochaetota bacterium]MBN2770504.1 flagellar export chaperone FliS [Spirochaetota bacterium]HRX15250.1 flagellar export chaperone FliS [Spirochaetota bacterium]